MDPGEKISATLKREFGEEALNSLQKSSAEKREIEEKLHTLFSQEHLVVRDSGEGGSAKGSAHKADFPYRFYPGFRSFDHLLLFSL